MSEEEKNQEQHQQTEQDHEQEKDNGQVEGNEDTVSMSKEELQKMMDSNADKRVSQALKTAQEKWEKDMEQKLQQKKDEAEELAKMSQEEKLQAEFDKQKKEFEQERQSFLKEKLELQTVKELQNENLPTEFSSFVLGENAEKTSENIKAFKDQWQRAIEKAVEDKLKGDTPKTSNSKAKVTPEQFHKMGYKERKALYDKDPELYKQLQG